MLTAPCGVSISSPDPSKWIGQLYLDLYNTNVDVPVSTGSTWNDGQPAEVPPVASLDTNGNVVLNVATGSVDLRRRTPDETYNAKFDA